MQPEKEEGHHGLPYGSIRKPEPFFRSAVVLLTGPQRFNYTGFDMEIAYHLIVLLVSGFSFYRGWRLGFVRQMGGILGMAFGCVVAHLFSEPASEIFLNLHLWPVDNISAQFAANLLGCTFIYAVTYFALWCIGRLLAEAMSIIRTGVLDSIFGALICGVKYLIALSIFFNFAVASNPESVLMKYACDDDGNIVEGVMLLGPYALGCQSYWDLAHCIQLREARKISYNYTAPLDVKIINANNGSDRVTDSYCGPATCKTLKTIDIC